MATVFVDIPVPWIKFHVGAGWGELSFDPDSVGPQTDTSDIEKINLWQWFARLGIPLPWNLDLLLGYREFHGRFVVRHNNNNVPDGGPATGIVTTAGIGYTF